MNLEEMAKWFYRNGGCASFELLHDEGLQPYALVRAGWLSVENIGRWGRRYSPAGELLLAYERFRARLDAPCPCAFSEIHGAGQGNVH